MATGSPPFQGLTSAVIFDAILNKEPASPLLLNPQLPLDIEPIIRKALEKDREVRYQSAADLRGDLKRLKRDADTGRSATWVSRASGTQGATRVRPAHRNRPIWIFMFIACVALIAASVWVVKRLTRPPAGPTWMDLASSSRLSLLVSTEDQISDPALAPDGKMLAYVVQDENDRFDLFVRRVAGERPVRLTESDAQEAHAQFSPDGEWIAFTRRRADGELPEICIVVALGGDVRPIIPNAAYPAWSPECKRLAFIHQPQAAGSMSLATATSDGSDMRTLFQSDGALPYLRGTSWSANGEQIAVVRSTGGMAGEIWLVPVAGDTAFRLTHDPE